MQLKITIIVRLRNILKWLNPNESTKSVYYAIKYNPDSNKEKDEWKMLELLLKNGAKTDVQISENPKGVNTPLTYTTECGYYGATKLLLNMVQIATIKKII